MKSLKSIQDLKNKKVLVRVDFNVPVGGDGIIDGKEDWRIRATLPTIEYLLKKGARVILMSHLGRPKASRKFIKSKVHKVKNRKYGLMPVAKHLGELLNREIKFVDDCVGEKVKKATEKMRAGEIILLENLRFYEEEKNNDEGFARKLAGLADVYVNNAFSVSPRQHASVCAIAKFLPSYAGLLLEKEIKVLSEAISNPKRPATVIIGGAKVETKLPVVEYLINKFDHILIGGVVANKILDDKKTFKNSPSPLFQRGKRLSVPSDSLLQRGDFQKENNRSPIIKLPSDFVWENNEKLDIGLKTAEEYQKIISDSKTIIWNGPMGVFEKENFSSGTKAISEAVAKVKGCTIIGGGDTIAAVHKFGDLKKVSYICTGGGAMLEFLAGKRLPGLEVLE